VSTSQCGTKPGVKATGTPIPVGGIVTNQPAPMICHHLAALVALGSRDEASSPQVSRSARLG
jgi:hypothetical protein